MAALSRNVERGLTEQVCLQAVRAAVDEAPGDRLVHGGALQGAQMQGAGAGVVGAARISAQLEEPLGRRERGLVPARSVQQGPLVRPACPHRDLRCAPLSDSLCETDLVARLTQRRSELLQVQVGKCASAKMSRGAGGAAYQLGAQHANSIEHWYAYMPGLKVVCPATPYDMKGLLKTSIRDDNPVCFFESELTYSLKGPVPEEEYTIPLGVADIKREGSDVTLVTWSKNVFLTLEVAAALEEEGISAEVVDLRTLRPLDKDAIFNSVAKTSINALR